MVSTPKWTDPEGISTLKKIIQRRVTQWPNGLRDFQLENIPRVLNGDKMLVFTATGDGKSSFFDVPLLVHMEVSEHPEVYPPFPIRKFPVAVVVTPTKGLANSIVSNTQYTYIHSDIILTLTDSRSQGIRHFRSLILSRNHYTAYSCQN
jgi:ATP-dependent helicase YprA (DUF1998 family)